MTVAFGQQRSTWAMIRGLGVRRNIAQSWRSPLAPYDPFSNLSNFDIAIVSIYCRTIYSHIKKIVDIPMHCRDDLASIIQQSLIIRLVVQCMFTIPQSFGLLAALRTAAALAGARCCLLADRIAGLALEAGLASRATANLPHECGDRWPGCDNRWRDQGPTCPMSDQPRRSLRMTLAGAGCSSRLSEATKHWCCARHARRSPPADHIGAPIP
jgi:hypothetical protein